MYQCHIFSLATIANVILSEIERIEKKLSNEGFVAKAPAAVVEGEKAKLVKYKETLSQLEDAVAKM